MGLLLTVFVALPLQVRPVARPMKVPLEQVVVLQQSAGVLVRFAPDVNKEQAKQILDGVTLLNPSVAFVKTKAGRWAGLTTLAPKVTVAQLQQQAEALSKVEGVEETDVWFHPGPREEDLEVEATWRYHQGEMLETHRTSFRDEPLFTQYARRKASRQEWEEARWPNFPLSLLTVRAGLPGRFALETPGGMAQLALNAWPEDAGENLSLLDLWLPDGVMLELRAEAELKKCSLSKVVGDTVEAAIKLGVKPDKEMLAAFDDDVKAPQRELNVYVSQKNYWRVEDAAERETVSASKVVHWAWRLAHPYGAKAKGKK